MYKFDEFTHLIARIYTPLLEFTHPASQLFRTFAPTMTLTNFFTNSPLWVSIPIALGYLAVAVVLVVLMVRLFRMKL